MIKRIILIIIIINLPISKYGGLLTEERAHVQFESEGATNNHRHNGSLSRSFYNYAEDILLSTPVRNFSRRPFCAHQKS